MQKEVEFNIVYDGPALETNEMEVKELAPALLALSELIEESNKVINDDKFKVSINVKGTFKNGSFLTQIIVHQNLISHFLTLFDTPSIDGALNLIVILGLTYHGAKFGLLQVIKWLRKRKISNIIQLENGDIKLIVQNEELEVAPEIVKLLENYKIRQSLERLITRPLQKDGIDMFAVKQDKDNLFAVSKEESSYFECPPLQEEELEDKTYIRNLQIVTLAFQDGNKWKVSDGTTPFYATVEDQNFLKKINNSEVSFAKGDILEAEVRKQVWLDIDGNMKAEYTVLKIIEHKSAAKQLRLL